MRTTLDIDDDVLVAAKDLARLKNQGIGRALSDLARRGLRQDATSISEVRNGIPAWIHPTGAVHVTTELIRNLADEE